MANNLVIWAQDAILPFNNSTPLMNSGFTTLIVASFHIHPDGSIWFNGHAMVDAAGNLQPMATLLKSIGSELLQKGGFTDFLISIGGGGRITTHQHNIYPDHSVSDEDFMAFYAQAFGVSYGENSTPQSSRILLNFGKLTDHLGVTGIDVDMEPMFFSYPDLASSVMLLSEWAASKRLKLTWSPYTEQPFWQSLAAQGQPLTWANIQPFGWNCYGDPAALASWAKSLQLSVGSIVAGFANNTGGICPEISPSAIQRSLADCIKQNVRIGGAYLWTYDDLFKWSPKEIATAMTNGLNGITPDD